MITKISSIKAAGVFDNYKWDNSLPSFQERVLIYGWNGCGKSTIARAISALTDESLRPTYQTIVEDGNGHTFNTTNNIIPNKIFVFNADFVEANSKYDHMQKIMYLSKENIKLTEELTNIETSLKKVLEKKEPLKQQVSDGKEELDGTYAQCAKDIKTTLVKFAPKTYLNYDKRNFRDAINEATVFPDDGNIICEIENLEKQCSEQPKDILQKVQNIEAEEIKAILREANECLKTNIISSAAEKYSVEILNWLKKGMELEENSICKYCGNTISKTRRNDLEKIFDKEYQEFQTKLDGVIQKIKDIQVTSLDLSRKNFYVKNYDVEDKIIKYNQAKTNIDRELVKLKKLLEEKKRKNKYCYTIYS